MKIQLWKSPFHLWTVLLVTSLLFFGCTSNSKSGAPVMNSSGKNQYLNQGQLLPCLNHKNCVSSEGLDGSPQIAPIEFTDKGSKAWKALKDLLLDMGGQIEEVDDSFLHATFRSSLFRFVDDVTCRLDEENRRIHIRSASRVGKYDFGVNRKRVEELRERFASSVLQE